jgi:hypothetical protein
LTSVLSGWSFGLGANRAAVGSDDALAAAPPLEPHEDAHDQRLFRPA